MTSIRRVVRPAFLTLLVTLTAAGQTTSRTTPKAPAAATAGRGTPRSTLQMLDQRLPNVQLDESPLQAALDQLGRAADLDIIVQWSAVESHGVSRQTPITLKARRLTLSQALAFVLSEAGGADGRLAYQATPELIVISTVEHFDRALVTRVYSVSDLLANVPRFRNAARLRTASVSADGVSVDSFVPEESEAENEPASPAAKLIELIQTTVEPASWASAGGAGTISEFNGQIVVRNTRYVHQLIAGPASE
ncbi:MAG: hypothetical protein CHACPFDD_01135 [Phycisphaerae bacterium]|nr:hypothetical protein [Phycisphaerae bacterium]